VERTKRVGELELVPYDPRWPQLFASEADRLRSALGELAVRVEHNGSTAVPKLSAKPVIDIQISVRTLRSLPQFVEPLSRLGYVHVPGPDDAFCPFFHRPACWPHTHHIHLVELAGEEERRTLAFRDFLRDHPDTAAEYETLKRMLAGQSEADDARSREAYACGKTEFIERVLSRALVSGYPRPCP
jgi:GrpB-like predicted nucleotidyltransferase (UPF0157 family)